MAFVQSYVCWMQGFNVLKTSILASLNTYPPAGKSVIWPAVKYPDMETAPHPPVLPQRQQAGKVLEPGIVDMVALVQAHASDLAGLKAELGKHGIASSTDCTWAADSSNAEG